MTDIYRTHIQDHGRVVIPAAVRQALGLQTGDEVIIQADANRVVITHIDNALAQFRLSVANHFPEDRDLVGELVAEGREEAARNE